MTSDDIQQYLYNMKTVKKASQANLAQAFSAIKYLYRHTLEMPLNLSEIKTARRDKKLPVVLSKEEVRRLLDSADNIKHKTVLMTIYSAGLRLSEATGLMISDIDSDRMQIRVNQGKGKKDRYTLLSNILLHQLRHYWMNYRPKIWLFPNRKQNKPIHPTTIQKIFRDVKKKPTF